MSSTIKSIYFLIFEIFIKKIFIDKTKFYVTDELTDEITFIQTIRRWIQFRNRSVLVDRIYKCLNGFSNWCRFIDCLRLSAEANTPMRGRYWGHVNLEPFEMVIWKVTLVPLNFFSSIDISCFAGSKTVWVGLSSWCFEHDSLKTHLCKPKCCWLLYWDWI